VGTLRVKLWGTRGLVSSPGHDTAIYGGNTPCVQILHKNNLIIVDTGFGCCNLGEDLLERILVNKEDLKIHIFYTHFHWDHIQALPFFMPIYFANTQLNIYSPEPQETTASNLEILFDASYSPFESLFTMPAVVKVHQITKNLEIDGLKIDFHAVDHGSSLGETEAHETYAYKFTNEKNESIALLTDHEARSSLRNDSLIEFAKECNLLIHDAQYTEKEYNKYAGWGHSTSQQALENALKMGAVKTLLTHHHPFRTDVAIEKINHELRQDERFHSLKFEFATELVEYEVGNKKKKKKSTNKVSKVG